MVKESMTPKERYLAVLNRGRPDRVPMEWRATHEIDEKMMKHLCCSMEEVFDRLHIDRIIDLSPTYIGPPIEPGYDMHGCRHQDVAYGTGSYDEVASHPLAQCNSVEEIEAYYTWPTADWFDFVGIPGQIKGKEMYPIRGGGSEPFLTYKDLRGMEQAYIGSDPEP